MQKCVFQFQQSMFAAAVPVATHEASVSAQKALHGSETETMALLGRKVFPHLKQETEKNELVARPSYVTTCKYIYNERQTQRQQSFGTTMRMGRTSRCFRTYCICDL